MATRRIALQGAIVLSVWVGLSGCNPAPVPGPVPAPVLVLEVAPDDVSPAGARQYQAMLTRNARAIWGLDAPVAVFAAQVQQESGWNANARSPVGAQGIAQFMPSTADWIDDAYPDLGAAQPYNPAWSLRALTQYDKHIFDRVKGSTECDRMAFALSGYNGGQKWVERDQAKAAAAGLDPLRYWGSVETVNGGRNAAAFTENRNYPRRIIRTLQPKYVTWGRGVCK